MIPVDYSTDFDSGCYFLYKLVVVVRNFVLCALAVKFLLAFMEACTDLDRLEYLAFSFVY